MAGPAGTPAALGVVGWCGGYVAHEHGVERCDVDAQLHGRRAKHNRKATQRSEVRRILKPFALVAFAVTETGFEQFAGVRIHLGGVFVSFEVETWAGAIQKGLGRCKIKIAEESIVLAFVLHGLVFGEAPFHAAGFQDPTDGVVPIHVSGLNETVTFCGTQKGFEELHQNFGFDGLDHAIKGRFLPEWGVFDQPDQA
ncbi:MAG: hypothetical protein BWY82_00380 [Verrucomicrobia bacterium ADurb.Bin474]|nr:MAG: hypothetical protein BWY82_00380 [Verrucomicrobia bacterium ADurb.Bin474]